MRLGQINNITIVLVSAFPPSSHPSKPHIDRPTIRIDMCIGVIYLNYFSKSTLKIELSFYLMRNMEIIESSGSKIFAKNV